MKKSLIHQNNMNEVTTNMEEQSKQCTDAIRKIGYSNWLSVVSVTELNKSFGVA